AAYTQKDILEAKEVLEHALLVDDNEGTDRWTPPIKDVSKWWDAETLMLLARIFSDFHTATLSQQSRNLLSIIFCRAIIELSSVSFGHQSMSFEKKPPSPGLLSVKHWVSTRFQQVGNEVLLSARESVYEGCGLAMLGD